VVAGPRERLASSTLLQVFLHWFYDHSYRKSGRAMCNKTYGGSVEADKGVSESSRQIRKKNWPARANFRTSCTREKDKIFFTTCNKSYLAFLISISIFKTYPLSLGGKIY
jgi:hypothetical protein